MSKEQRRTFWFLAVVNLTSGVLLVFSTLFFLPTSKRYMFRFFWAWR
jgi:hypothetical protein